jgi:DNA-binding MurR/RpiR family transcriptional regulator
MIPQDVNGLNTLLQSKYDKLSKKMQLIAVYIIDQPQQLATNTLASIADDIGVYPSTLVRFAQTMGFSGFAQLQKLFKVRITQTTINYSQRIVDVKKVIKDDIKTSTTSIFYDIIERNIGTTKLLSEQIDPALIDKSVQMIHGASEVLVCGINRACPVVVYFNYMLNNLGIRCRIADNISMGSPPLDHWFSDKSVLIAVTYNPYSFITTQTVKIAKQSKTKVILITDTELNPIADLADHLFIVHEAEIHTFRSLNATLCLAQTMCVSIGYNQKKQKT